MHPFFLFQDHPAPFSILFTHSLIFSGALIRNRGSSEPVVLLMFFLRVEVKLKTLHFTFLFSFRRCTGIVVLLFLVFCILQIKYLNDLLFDLWIGNKERKFNKMQLISYLCQLRDVNGRQHKTNQNISIRSHKSFSFYMSYLKTCLLMIHLVLWIFTFKKCKMTLVIAVRLF